MLFDYDNSNPQSILKYAKQMENKSFADLLDIYNKSSVKSYKQAKSHMLSVNEKENVYVATSEAKGLLGNFIEKYYFGYEPNGNQEADFSLAGVELKQTPIDIKKNGEYTAGERLSITMISFKDPVIEDFYHSHVWDKIKNILLIHYIRSSDTLKLDYKIKFVNLFTPPKEDLDVIITDYKLINSKIKNGKAETISEADTLYLGACTKGSTAAKSLVNQLYGNHSLAKRRNYCFKRSYMDYILKHYILHEKDNSESIVKDSEQLKLDTLEHIVLGKLKTYYKKSDIDLLKLFNVTKSKETWACIVYRILGIGSNKATEFVKAGIKIKVIRVEEDGSVREHMPLPSFVFNEIVKQSWEESDLYYQLAETKYLFVMFHKYGDNYYLSDAKFWSMKNSDLDIVEKEWNRAKQLISSGITFKLEKGIVRNNLPGIHDGVITHIRPHTSKSAYKLNGGYNRGNIKKNADRLPDGQWMTKQCFWINKDYLIKELNIK